LSRGVFQLRFSEGIIPIPAAGKAELLQPGPDIGIGHEQLPQKSGPVILNHDHDRPLIDRKIRACIPVMGLAERIGEAEAAPNPVA
jgi:hypothetical protein